MARAKLSPEAVLAIRAEKPCVCASCGREVPFAKNLSRRFKIATSTIRRIRRGEFHKRIKEDAR